MCVKSMKINIICPSEIAYRRFMPALTKASCFEFAGVGYHSSEEVEGKYSDDELNLKVINSREKTQKFIQEFGGIIYDSYNEAILDKDVKALYLPLPPSFHYKYAKMAIENFKNVLIEKPATLSYSELDDLIRIAKKKGVALHENYMFVFHSQLSYIKNVLEQGEIGDVRLYRIAFGFPFRGKNDFRYNRSLGGGSLIDAGGYTIKLANYLLGGNSIVESAISNFTNEFDVDLYGQGVIKNEKNQVAQITFGMDNDYKCELEVWGSKGTLYTNRIFTAPVDYNPQIMIRKNGVEEITKLDRDDSFLNSILYFKKCIDDENIREKNNKEMLVQAKIFDDFKQKAGLSW